MNGCTELEEIAAYAQDDLAAPRADEIRAHLAVCEDCREHLAKLSRVDRALRALAHTEPPPEVAVRVRAALDRRTPTSVAEIMTPADVAVFLRIEPDDLDLVMAELPAFEIAGQIRVRRTRLLEWIEQRERQHLRDVMHSRLMAQFRAVGRQRTA